MINTFKVCDNYESTVSVAAPPIPSDLDKTYDDLSLTKTNMKKHLEMHNRLDQYEFDDDADDAPQIRWQLTIAT